MAYAILLNATLKYIVPIGSLYDWVTLCKISHAGMKVNHAMIKTKESQALLDRCKLLCFGCLTSKHVAQHD